MRTSCCSGANRNADELSLGNVFRHIIFFISGMCMPLYHLSDVNALVVIDRHGSPNALDVTLISSPMHRC